MGFLDETGLAHLWAKIKALVPDKSKKAQGLYYGELDDTSTATVMTAQIDGITELTNGVTIVLKNGVITSASGWTLNINNLGAKPVYSSMAEATRITTTFNIAYTMVFTYDEDRVSGGCWVMHYGYYTNTNTIGYQIRTNSTNLPMESVTYRYRLLFMSPDNTHYVPATNSTSTNATTNRAVNQSPINPFGEIVYYGTTASVAAGSRPSATYLWTQYVVTLGYSFAKGSALTMTAHKPVYLKCEPQSDGSAIIDATTPWVQDLPTTEDGKIYIYLGVANAETTLELVTDHPVYCYKDGAIRTWTNADTKPKCFMVNFTADYNASPVTYSCDKTFAEIKSAIENEMPIAYRENPTDTNIIYPWACFTSSDDTYVRILSTTSFGQRSAVEGYVTSYYYDIDSNDAVTRTDTRMRVSLYTS